MDAKDYLHAVAGFSKALPNGDRGGNGVRVPNPDGGERESNLHWYWDGLIGKDDDPAAVNELADRLMADYPRCGFADELTRTEIRQWAEEGVAIALKTVYHDLDAKQTRFTDLAVRYAADARRAARRRAALAGYRLAEELKRLFGEK